MANIAGYAMSTGAISASTLSPWDSQNTTQNTHGKEAAGVLASYMHQNGINDTDPNQLYQFATNKGGDIPPDVQGAAAYMLKNPEVYKQIETNDNPAADGKSSAAGLSLVSICLYTSGFLSI